MIKKFKIFILFMFLLQIQNISFAEILGYTNDKNIDMEDSIKLAVLNNRSLMSAYEEISIVKYKTDEALSYRYPQLDLLASYSHYKLDSTNYFIGNAYDGFFLNNLEQDSHIFRLNLSQIIYNGRRTKNTKKTSEISLKKAESEFQIIKNNIIYNTKLLFLKWLLFKKILETLNEYKSYMYILDISKSKAGLDSETINDIDSSYHDLLFSIENTKVDLDSTKIIFFNTIGVEQNSIFEITGNLEPIEMFNKDLDSCIAKALYLRPELISSEASEELGSLEINISMSEKNPVLALKASYQYSSDNFTFDKLYWNKDWHLGFNVNIPLFDGGALIARNNQKKSNLRKLQLKRTDNEENIKLSVQKAYMQNKLWKKKLNYESEFFARYEKNFSLIKTDFKLKNAIFTKLDLLFYYKEIKKYYDFKIKYLTTIFEYNKSMLDIHFAIGDIS